MEVVEDNWHDAKKKDDYRYFDIYHNTWFNSCNFKSFLTQN